MAENDGALRELMRKLFCAEVERYGSHEQAAEAMQIPVDTIKRIVSGQGGAYLEAVGQMLTLQGVHVTNSYLRQVLPPAVLGENCTVFKPPDREWSPPRESHFGTIVQLARDGWVGLDVQARAAGAVEAGPARPEPVDRTKLPKDHGHHKTRERHVGSARDLELFTRKARDDVRSTLQDEPDGEE